MDPNEVLQRNDVPDEVKEEFKKILCENEEKSEKLKESSCLFKEMIDGFALHDVIYDRDEKPVDYRFLEVNPAFENLTSLKREEIIGKTVREVLPDIDNSWIENYCRVALTGEGTQFENYSQALNRYFSVRVYCPRHGRVATIINDNTRQKQLEEQLRHAQKMEAIGRFASGISHDFNNKLTAIVGYSDMIMHSIETDEQTYAMLSKIKSAGIKSASLARQLMLFSKKHSLVMRTVNINTCVTNLKKMLGRIIGEDIELKTFLVPDLGLINGDITHIEQMLANLAINARDAMQKGGKVTIETRNVTIDEENANAYPEFKQGNYVILSVSDNGPGIDSEIKDHILEPFFTTKEQDGRTGLGLSTVYGIVQQHKGHMHIYSEPGKGAAFKMFFPMVMHDDQGTAEQEQEKSFPAGEETILLVEDEPIVRKLTVTVLETIGYKVVATGSPEKALNLVRRKKVHPDLLVSDVVMPQLNGKELHEKLISFLPNLKVLFISGYPGNVIIHHGILGKEENFLPKPFPVKVFTQKVREILDN